MKIGIMFPQEWEKGQSDPVEAYERMTGVAQEAEALGVSMGVCRRLRESPLAEWVEQNASVSPTASVELKEAR